MSKWVVDSSAILALVKGEPGADVVRRALIEEAVISAVNLAEVASKLSERGAPDEQVRETLDGLGLMVEPLTKNLAYDAGALRQSTRPLGLSLGDRVCLALGRQLGLPVITTDRSWTGAVPGAIVRQLR